jgi:c-di-AMP phosphodiesterase-like protein
MITVMVVVLILMVVVIVVTIVMVAVMVMVVVVVVVMVVLIVKDIKIVVFTNDNLEAPKSVLVSSLTKTTDLSHRAALLPFPLPMLKRSGEGLTEEDRAELRISSLGIPSTWLVL